LKSNFLVHLLIDFVHSKKRNNAYLFYGVITRI